MAIEAIPVGDTATMWVVITLLFKLLEKTIGKAMYHKNADQRDRESMDKIEEVHSMVKDTKGIMDDLKLYARQNADNAVRMATLLEQIIRRDE